MTLDLKLDTASIDKAIRKLKDISFDVGELTDVMCEEGASVANEAYGSMASAYWYRESEDTDKGIAEGVIFAESDNEDKLLIAEFGAGNATVKPKDYFESDYDTGFDLDLWIFPGAYSLYNGSMEYWYTSLFGTTDGYWHFGGRKYTEVKPRQGLYKAKEHLKSRAAQIVEEVIRID